MQAVWLYLLYCQPPASGLNEGQLTRLNRKLSFTLVFGTFSYVLERGINIVSTKVPLCPFCVKYWTELKFFLKASTAALKLNCLFLKVLKFLQLSLFIKIVNPI